MANQEIQKRDPHPVSVLKSYMSNESVKARFEEMLGKRSGAFIQSVITLYRNSPQLQKCTPESVSSSAIRAAAYNMPVDPALGFAAIVPYDKTAQFQFMYKGITQLCIRSNQYKTIHCSEVYADEIKHHNPITGEVVFNVPSTYKMRSKGNFKNVVGHYAYFKLLSGFEKADYMTTEEAMAHGAKYSAAYKYDLKQKKKISVWSTDPVVMCNKTILLRLLTKYGVMSIEMQDALIRERETFEESEYQAKETIDTESGSQPVDTEFEKEPEEEQPSQDWMEDDS